MICLDIQEYCSACFDFEPDVTKPFRDTVYGPGNEKTVFQTDTIVRCKYARRCEAVKRYLEQQIEGK